MHVPSGIGVWVSRRYRTIVGTIFGIRYPSDMAMFAVVPFHSVFHCSVHLS